MKEILLLKYKGPKSYNNYNFGHVYKMEIKKKWLDSKYILKEIGGYGVHNVEYYLTYNSIFNNWEKVNNE